MRIKIKLILPIVLLLYAVVPTLGTHLMGGNLIYEYLGDTDSDGNYNYKIIFYTYINCNYFFVS